MRGFYNKGRIMQSSIDHEIVKFTKMIEIKGASLRSCILVFLNTQSKGYW